MPPHGDYYKSALNGQVDTVIFCLYYEPRQNRSSLPYIRRRNNTSLMRTTQSVDTGINNLTGRTYDLHTANPYLRIRLAHSLVEILVLMNTIFQIAYFSWDFQRLACLHPGWQARYILTDKIVVNHNSKTEGGSEQR